MIFLDKYSRYWRRFGLNGASVRALDARFAGRCFIEALDLRHRLRHELCRRPCGTVFQFHFNNCSFHYHHEANPLCLAYNNLKLETFIEG